MSTPQIGVDPAEPGERLYGLGPSKLWTRRIYWNSPPFASTAGTTGNLDFTGFPGGLLIEGAFIIFTQNWTGGTVNAATLSIGTTGTADAYLAATSAFTGATTLTTPVAVVGKALVPGTFLATPPQGQATVRVQLLTTAGNINTLVAGRADIFLQLRACPMNVK